MPISRFRPAPRPAPESGARLHLTLVPHGRHCSLRVAGSLDASSSVAVDIQHDQLVRAGFHHVLLDVSGIRRIDESGAVALAQLWARLRSTGVSCEVRGLHPVFGGSPLELLLHVRDTGRGSSGGTLRAAPSPPEVGTRV